jgi:hypothetical protein
MWFPWRFTVRVTSAGDVLYILLHMYSLPSYPHFSKERRASGFVATVVQQELKDIVRCSVCYYYLPVRIVRTFSLTCFKMLMYDFPRHTGYSARVLTTVTRALYEATWTMRDLVGAS